MRTIPKLFQKLGFGFDFIPAFLPKSCIVCKSSGQKPLLNSPFFGITSVLQNREEKMQIILGSLFVEAAVVGVVCIIFLVLFVVAGVWQRRKNGKY